MFLPKAEINNYPFTGNSSLRINDTGYTLPPDLLLDACIYPRCDNNPPFHIARMDKWVWSISDNSGATAFTVVFPETRDRHLQDYYIGYCYDGVGSCGTVLGTDKLYSWLKAVPLSQAVPSDSFVFSAGAVRPVGQHLKKRALFVNKRGLQLPALSVSWGDNISVSASGVATIDETLEYPDSGKDTPITTLVVNGVYVSGGRSVNIVPTPGSKVRVLARSEIQIGKVTEV